MEPSVRTDRVAGYLAELRPHLDDLDPAERAEVLDELTDALREVAAEDDRPLREVLGPPADYVAAYRTSAGLESGPSRSRGRLRTRLKARVTSVKDTVRAQPWWPHVIALARLLRPSWWTVRGGALAVAAGWLFMGSLPAVVATVPGLLFVTAAVALSMALRDGRHLRRGRHALAAANVVAALAVLPMIDAAMGPLNADGWDDGYQAGLAEPAMDTMGQLTKPSGEPVTNIYPYTRDGELLEDVLLFDGAGQPLRLAFEDQHIVSVGSREFEIAYERDADGQPITNLYPFQQYVLEYDDITGEEIRRPRTVPTIVLPPSVRRAPTEAPAPEPTAEGSAPAVAPSEQ